jgi:hypothetical protein
VNTVDRERMARHVQELGADRFVSGIVCGLFGVYLLLVVVAQATDSILAWQLAASSVVLGAVLGCRLAVDAYQGSDYLLPAVLSVVVFALVVLGVVYRSSSPGLGLGPSRSLAAVLVLVLIVAFVLVVTDARRYTTVEWFAIGCFTVLAGLYLLHASTFDPSSSQSRWPVWATVVMGINLFVIPRLVPERIFLWLLSRITAAVVILGLFTYIVGDYTLWIFEVSQYSPTSPSVPGFDPDVATLQSIFVNPNSLGLLAFAGLVAAVVELHRAVIAERVYGAGVAGALVAICGLGLFLTNARAGMLAAAIAITVYAAAVVGGRATIPAVAGSLAVGVLGLVAGMYFSIIDISATSRFELWSATMAAIRDGPWLFGYGSGPAGPVIEPYLPADVGAGSPHNAYLQVTLQTGLVGGLAYLGIVVGTVAAKVVDYREVDVVALAFAIGWAVHQGFESYTMFRWEMPAVLASLTIGYLLFDE